MTNTPDAREFQDRLRRLEGLLQETERSADPAAQAHTREVVRALLELHAAGLERIFEHVAAAGAAGDAVIDACAADDIVGGLLLLHGLHPLGLEDRVRQALDRVRPALLRSHGGTVELLGVEDGVVRLRLGGSCDDGCSSSAATVRQAVEEAVIAKAPDVTAIEVEMPAAANGSTRIALPVL